MGIFRRKTIFHVEDALPDPEEIKLRFRRRVLLLTFAGFLAVLSIPVARDLKADLDARSGARKFAEKILESRSLASSGRTAVSLELAGDSRSWKRVFHGSNDITPCGSPSPGADDLWDSELLWKVQLQKTSGETFSGRNLCLDPTQGLLLDSVPVADGKLLIAVLNEEEEGRAKEAAYLLVSQFGAEIEMVSRWNY